MTRAHHSQYGLAPIALGLFLCGSPGDARTQDVKARIALGPEVHVSRNEDFAHVEAMLATDPADPRRLLASCLIMVKDTHGNFVPVPRAYVSRDAGRTWTAEAERLAVPLE